MAKTYRKKKVGRKRVIYGKTLERCVQCGQLEYCNHTKCEWCHQPLCYRVSFGLVWMDCEYGIIQRRDRNTGEIFTYHMPAHKCKAKIVAHWDANWWCYIV